jgi:hypothetical protein
MVIGFSSSSRAVFGVLVRPLNLDVRSRMPLALIIGLLLVGAAVLVLRYKGRRALVIRSPRFGVLNLKGQAAEPLIAADIEALTPLLGTPIRGSALAPFCDVLFLYCDVDSKGCVGNGPGTLRDLIQKLRAPLVVVASENSGDAYVASTKGQIHGRTNLVMTLSRRGDAFPTFFVRLFRDMKKGVSMPMAWVKLSPQGPSQKQESLPSTIFACEAGQMVFK